MPDTTAANKRQRLDPIDPAAGAAPLTEDGFIQDRDAVESGGEDDDDEDKPKDKKAGRRKIKIEFIQDKSRRHITFSKRKAGIMKKAYELSTLTGTQVLLLVVSETGLVYTFTTAKLQPLVTQPEGKNLIQACLNAPHGQLPSSMPVGTPLGRSSGPMSTPHSPATPAAPPNVPGGLSIGGKDEEAADDAGDVVAPDTNDSVSTGRKRRRASSTTTAPNTRAAQPPPPPPPTASGASQAGNAQAAPAQGPTTSPHARQTMPLPMPVAQQPGQMPPQSPTGYYQPGDPNAAAMYPGYGAQPGAAPQGAQYYVPQGAPAGHEQPQAGMAWGPAPGVQQNNHYTRR